MDNKKVWLTVILAGILAIAAAALLFFRMPDKKEIIPAEEQQNVVETQEISTEKILPEGKPEQPAPKTPAVKNVSQKNVQTSKPEPTETKVKPAVGTPEIIKETPVTEIKSEEQKKDEQGIIVPVEYKSKNSFKYVYTPNRF